MNYPKVLQKILEQKWSEIQKIPDLPLDLTFPTFSLKKFLLSEKGSIIAECKKASPSKGVIRKNYDPVKIALEYQNSGAKALSVLTDEKFFMGSLEDLKNVSQNVALPVLRKDFLLHEKQILEARHYGASAVLLIVRILETRELKSLYELAKSLAMD
ncbi:MAG: indole-3-glycerol phosphate synthase TrpC, partial [Leptospiraceae bacterium]|nr:indole-3-glycerol phosphate synthase TrpC [Leptospiraceae bacterium]